MGDLDSTNEQSAGYRHYLESGPPRDLVHAWNMTWAEYVQIMLSGHPGRSDL